MKSLFNPLKSHCTNLTKHNARILTRISKHQFAETLKIQKDLENSDEDEIQSDQSENPLLESLKQREAFRAVASGEIGYKPAEVHRLINRRQNRQLFKVDESHQFSGILNATSAKEIWRELEIMKAKSLTYDQTSKTKSIMDAIDSLIDNPEPSDNEKDVNDIIYDTKPSEIRLARGYAKAIKRCGLLGEFEEGLKMFEEAKEGKNSISASVFASAITLQMSKELSIDSLEKCVKMVDEMKDKYNIWPSAQIYAELIKNCIAVRQFRRAWTFIRFVMNDKQQDHLASTHLRDGIMNYFAKTKQIEEGLQFMSKIAKEYGNEALTPISYSTMLSGIALVIDDGNERMIEAAEKLFQQSFTVLGKDKVNCGVFSSLLACYAAVPDMDSCMDLLRNMINDENAPNPIHQTYASCLKGLTKYYRDPLTYEQGWKYADEILELMKQCPSQPHPAIYGLLFQLCGGSFCGKSDLKKLYGFYDEMKEKGIPLQLPTANSLLLSGMDHFKMEIENNPENKEEIQKELLDFIDWAMLQFKQYNLKMTKYQNDLMQRKLEQIASIGVEDDNSD